MGEMSLWSRIQAWLLHPIAMSSGAFVSRYLNRHSLVMEYAEKYDRMHAAWRSSEQASQSVRRPKLSAK